MGIICINRHMKIEMISVAVGDCLYIHFLIDRRQQQLSREVTLA